MASQIEKLLGFSRLIIKWSIILLRNVMKAIFVWNNVQEDQALCLSEQNGH